MNCQTVFEHDVQLQGDDVFSCPHCSRDGHVVSPH
jgi:ubiquitin C-terminal hydrolase